jgi:hypothetical protein
MSTARFWCSAAVLSCALLFQSCQSHSLRATEEEELSASPSSASVMREHTPSEPMAVQPLVLPSGSLVAHVSSSRFSTTLASEEVRSAAPSSIPLSLVARHALAAVGNSPTVPNNLPAATVPKASCSEPSGDEHGRALSPDSARVCESKLDRVLREMLSDEGEDSKPPAQQRSTNLASEDDLANKELRAGEEEAEEGAKNVHFALKTLGEVEEVHCVEQRRQSEDPLAILLAMAGSEPNKAIQFLDVLLVAAQDNGCRQQALEALGRVAKASPSMLSACLPSLRAAAKGGDQDVRLLSLKTLGEVEWRHYFGEVESAPDLPRDMATILDSACPFWPGKKVRDTHLLVLIPATVDEAPFTLNLLEELIQHPKNGEKKTRYRHYNDTVKAQIGASSPAASYWLLMTCDVLPESCSKKYVDQRELVANHARRTGLNYEVPKALEAATAVLMHHVRSGRRLRSAHPRTFTRHQDLIRSPFGGEYPAVVGGFGSSGIVVSNDVCDYGSRCRSVTGCRKFF